MGACSPGEQHSRTLRRFGGSAEEERSGAWKKKERSAGFRVADRSLRKRLSSGGALDAFATPDGNPAASVRFRTFKK
jgi:hypothetical protein